MTHTLTAVQLAGYAARYSCSCRPEIVRYAATLDRAKIAHAVHARAKIAAGK